jgi:hypothetical protein
VVPSGEYPDVGGGGDNGCGVRAGAGMFRGASHAFMVVFPVSNVSAVPCVECVTAAG